MNSKDPGDSTDYKHWLVDRLPSMVAYWDSNLRCRFANQAYKRWFGVDPTGLIGTSLRDLLGPDLFALNEPHIRAALRGEEQTFERSIPGPGGITRESLANYIPDVVDGRVAGFLVQVTDVTPLRAAQAALKANEAYLRELFRLSHEGILIADHDGRYVDVSDSCCEMLGYARSEILGKTFEDLLEPSEIGRLPEARAQLRAGERHVEEWALRCKDGTSLPAEVRAKLLPDGRRVGFLLDIRAHKSALAAEHSMAEELERQVAARTDDLVRTTARLQLGEARLRGIFDSTTEGIITADESQTIVEANAAAARMFRCELGDLLGAPLSRFIPLRHREAHARHVRKFGERQIAAASMTGRDVMALRSDGSEFPIDASISHVTFGDHKLYTVIHRDITGQKKMLAELEASREELRQLVVAMDTVQEDERKRIARELHDDLQQTIVAMAMNVAGMSEARQRLPAGDRRLLSEIEELARAAIESTRRIIHDLRPQVLEDLGLVPALEVLARQFGRRHGIECRVEARSAEGIDAQRMPAETTCLFRVTQEALNNVARHARATEVRIDLERKGEDLVVLRIRDNGVGLATTERRKQGRFGLVGMRERVRALGGGVTISGLPGSGTSVEVTLPLAEPRRRRQEAELE